MSENLIKTQDVFLEKINKICRDFGLNNIMAQLYAILYFSNKALSLNDMVDRLKISKGSASINIRALARYGAVRNVWIKGSRRDFYEAETNISKVIIDRVKSMAERRISEVSDIIKSSSEALDLVHPSTKEEKESVEIFKSRLNELRKLYNKAQGLFNIVNSGLLSSMLGAKAEKNNKKEKVVV